MKIHKFEIVIFDFENYGIENYKTILSNHRDFTATILSSNTADIGEWGDNHVLNKNTTEASVYRKYFAEDE